MFRGLGPFTTSLLLFSQSVLPYRLPPPVSHFVPHPGSHPVSHPIILPVILYSVMCPGVVLLLVPLWQGYRGTQHGRGADAGVRAD